jgi:ABC-type transport system involved in multi-copper enzyme maturation permease subunit
MLFKLIQKEIISHLLSLRFAATFVVILLLVFTSLYLTANQYLKRQLEFGANTARFDEALDDIAADEEDEGWRKWRRLFWQEGRSVTVSTAPLSSVVEGLTRSHPAGVNVTRSQTLNIDAGAVENPLKRLYHTPDYVYVVGFVISLLSFLFVFDTISGEKESGMLRLVLSNAAPRDQILLSKWIGGYIVLIAPFLVATIGGIGYARGIGVLELSSENVSRLALLVVAAMLFISVCFTVGMFISCLTHRAATALFMCLFVWVAWVLAVPNVAPVAAKIISPAPSPRKIKSEKDAVDKEIDARKNHYQQSSGETWGGATYEREMERLDKEGDRRKTEWDNYLKERRRSQARWAQNLGRLSPSASWVYAAAYLTQTGPAAYERFEEARERMFKGMKQLDEKTDDYWDKNGKNMRFEHDEIPILKTSLPVLGDSVNKALPDLLILAILNVLFFMASFAAFLRYDVR